MNNPRMTQVQIRIDSRLLDLIETWAKDSTPKCNSVEEGTVKALEKFFEGSNLKVVTTGCQHPHHHHGHHEHHEHAH